MANPKIQVDITADATKLKKGAKEAEGALGDVDKAAGKLGATVADVSKDKLGPLGDVASRLGVDLDDMSAKSLAVGAAVAGMATFIAGGVEKLNELTNSTRQYKDAAKIGWEEASRFNAVFKDFGIEADDGIDALKTLGEEAGDAPEKFERFGIEIAKTSAGTVDLSKTLQNASQRFKEIQDPTTRAAMGAALFGDNWLRIAPVLEQGGDGLAKLIDGVDESRIVTAEAAAEQIELQQASRDLNTAVDSLQMSLARGLVPALGNTAKGLVTVLEGFNKLGGKKGVFDGLFTADALKRARELEELDKAGSMLAVTVDVLSGAMAKNAIEVAGAAAKEKDLADAQASTADKTQILEANTKDAAAAAKELTKQAEAQTAALKDNIDTVLSVNGAVLSYEQAQLAAADAADELTVKQQAVTDAINEFGSDAPEATKAQRDYEKATLDSLSAMDGAAQAAVNQAEQLAKAAGQTFTAEQKSIVYREALEKLKGTSNDPAFISGMDGMISRAGAAADQYSRAAREAWALEAAASAAALAAAGVGNVGTGGMAGVTADNAERILSNQRSIPANAGDTAINPAGVTVQMDGYTVGQLVSQRQQQYERATR